MPRLLRSERGTSSARGGVTDGEKRSGEESAGAATMKESSQSNNTDQPPQQISSERGQGQDQDINPGEDNHSRPKRLRLAAEKVENYEKGDVREVDDDVNLTFDPGVIHLKVKAGRRLHYLIGFAIKKMKEPRITQLTWNANGAGITSAVTCAKMMKRKIKGLHQITRIRYVRTKVSRDTQAITILLSKTPLNSSDPGYQPPESFEAFRQSERKSQKSRADKRKPSGRARNKPSSAQSSDAKKQDSDARKRTKKQQGAKKNSAEKDAKNKSNMEDSNRMETEAS